MKVTDIERIVVDVPFTERQQRITQRTVYNWSILELCRVTADTGDVGWGEMVIHYTHQRVRKHNLDFKLAFCRELAPPLPRLPG